MNEAAERLVIRSELAELDRLLAFIDAFCESRRVADEVKHRLFLVVEELAVNTISHGYGGRSDGRIEVGLKQASTGIEIVVADEAPPFDPLGDRAPPDLEASVEDRGIGGLGIHFVRTLTDRAEYRFEGGRNVVRAVLAGAA